MSISKGLITASLVVSAAMLFGGCSKQQSKVVWMIPSHRAHPVWLVGKAGFEKACKEQGYTAKWEAANAGEEDVNQNYMEQAIVEKAAGIIVFPGSGDGFNKTIDKAVAAGIPVVTVHGDAPKSKRKCFIGPNKQKYAEDVADRIGQLLKGKGNVAVMQGSHYPNENEVADFFVKRMNVKFPGIKILTHDYEGTEVLKATQKDIDTIGKFPNMQAVFCTTGGGAVTWSKAMEETKTLGKITVISMDLTKENLDMVKSGKIYAVVGQGIYDEGYKGVSMLFDKSKGVTYTESPIITKDVVDKYYAQTGGM